MVGRTVVVDQGGEDSRRLSVFLYYYCTVDRGYFSPMMVCCAIFSQIFCCVSFWAYGSVHCGRDASL